MRYKSELIQETDALARLTWRAASGGWRQQAGACLQGARAKEAPRMCAGTPDPALYGRRSPCKRTCSSGVGHRSRINSSQRELSELVVAIEVCARSVLLLARRRGGHFPRALGGEPHRAVPMAAQLGHALQADLVGCALHHATVLCQLNCNPLGGVALARRSLPGYGLTTTWDPAGDGACGESVPHQHCCRIGWR